MIINITIIILILGIILLTIYITKATTNYYNKSYNYGLNQYYLYDDIYSYKISDVLKTMFTEPEIIQDYKTIDTKIYKH